MRSSSWRWHAIALVFAIATCLNIAFGDNECRPEDFIGQYTACENGHRNLIYYKNPDARCTGTSNQPENVFDIPCAISCPSGQYLRLGSTNQDGCTPCASGRYSLGGGTRIEGSAWIEDARGWSAVSNSHINFRTTCVNLQDGTIPPIDQCSRWQITGGSFAYSGLKTGNNHMTTLEATATFVRNGSISFEYRVDAERGFDYFSFEIDEIVVIPHESQQLSYVKVTYNVPVGTHVFKWKYQKDFSLEYGDDTAFVRMIEVTGTAFADSQCTLCPAGSFATGTGNSECHPCPRNTQAPNPGTSTCQACSATQYSFPGSTTCKNSAPCTENDVISYFTPCFANRTRIQKFEYQTPKICYETDAYRKPADKTAEICAPCSPGWFRNDDGLCEGCPANHMSTSGAASAAECTRCESGTVGRRDFIWTHFDELPNPSVPASMGCNGECGTPGWRLGPSYIDSGVGHNAYADSWFSLNLTVVSASTMTYNFSFQCERLCYISYTDYDVTPSNRNAPQLMHTRSAYSLFFQRGLIIEMTVNIAPGDHQLTWHFGKFDASQESRDDRVRVHGIQVKSVKEGQGGAASCQACSAGYFAAATVPFCQLTPPGHFSHEKADRPTPCPANTYAELAGTPNQCLNCGAGTTAPVGSSWCDESCKFQLRSDLSYDLKPLSRVQGDMYGPIADPSSRRFFYLNVCTREHTNSSCVDDDGIPLSTQACMTDNWGYGMDLGRLTNFYPHPTNPEMGLTLTYTRSKVDEIRSCRVNGQLTNVTSTIIFNCDPTEGYGTPSYNRSASNSCTYRFDWNTVFACPACDDSDWSYYYTECTNGRQMKVYQWKDNPRKCHGGEPLPESESRTCSIEDQILCPSGQYLLEECTDCENGKFSLGGSRIINYWQKEAPLPEPFRASRADAAISRGNFVQLAFPKAAQETSVTLSAAFNFIQDSKLEFYASIFVGDGYSLTLRQDSQDFLPLATHVAATKFEVPVLAGTHTFTFNLTKSKIAGQLLPGFVRIYNVTAVGVARAASQCTASHPGSIVTAPNKEPVICPINTYQPNEAKTECLPVPSGQWAPAGSAKAYHPPNCNYEDYTGTVTGACGADRKVNVNLAFKTPRICSSGIDPVSTITVPCGCPPGRYLNGAGVCISCPSDEALDPVTGRCMKPTKGSAAVKVWSLISKGISTLPAPSNSLPATRAMDEAHWTTSCTGTCFRAWSLSPHPTEGFVLDSGVAYSTSISTLDVYVPMANQAGTLTVAYKKFGGTTTSFSILVDGTVVHTQSDTENPKTVSVPLKAADHHKISLVIMVEPDTRGLDQFASSVIRVSELSVTGSRLGASVIKRCPAGTFASQDGAAACLPCQPGSHAPSEGSSVCTLCPAGSFAAFYGSAICQPCGQSTTSEEGAAICSGSCSIQIGEATYDWRDLPAATAKLTPDQRAQGYPDLEVNACLGVAERCNGNAAFVCGTAPLSASSTKLNYGSRLARQSFISSSAGILLRFDSGERCLSSGTRESSLTLRCPPKGMAPQSAPTITSISDCSVDLTWWTNSACPACTLADYKAVPGECIGRQQTITYVIDNEGCHHSEYTQPAPSSKKCSSIGVSLGVVVGVGIALALMGVSLAIFCIRHRKLTTEYRLLKDAHDSNFDLPETQFGVDDEDDGVTLDHIDDDDDGLRLPTAQTADDDN